MSDMPEENNSKKVVRGALQIASVTPYVGGFFSAIAGVWSEKEQEKVNHFFKQWIKMLEDEIREKEQTIIEILSRLDMTDQKIAERVESKEYQSLIRKTFREWSGAESENKRILIRNILSNAAATNVSSDDVLKLFIDWINTFSELHFQVIGAVYNSNGISRGDIWKNIGKEKVREDSADADLYKLLIRDLSMGGIIRQHRETDRWGNFVAKKPAGSSKGDTMKSAFDTEEEYVLTSIGQQFVHYAMTELTIRIEYQDDEKSKG